MKNHHKGFTLIEIVIVLAIAALILVIVFLAIAGAQRSQKDNASRQAASRVIAAYGSYLSNNNNIAPSNAGAGSALSSYVGGIKDGRGVSLTYMHEDAGSTVDWAEPGTFIYSIGAYCLPKGRNGKDDSIDEMNPATSRSSIAVAFYSESAKRSICVRG